MNTTRCNRCDRSLVGNMYQNHWKECTRRRIIKSDVRTIPLGLLGKEKKRIKRIKKKTSWLKSNKLTVTHVDTHWVYSDKRWADLRYKILRRFEFKCLACKSTNTELHVDHIKPISKYPSLAFDENNLQVLCKLCNLSKSNKYEDDLR
jgi:5-methylcytosine-specific restriction endonuclease McrA